LKEREKKKGLKRKNRRRNLPSGIASRKTRKKKRLTGGKSYEGNDPGGKELSGIRRKKGWTNISIRGNKGKEA